VFKCFRFLCAFIMSIEPVMDPYLYPAFNMWFEQPDLLLLFLTTYICSLYLVWNSLLVCPTYFRGQTKHFIW
jgi:hypothetical protein